MRATYSPEDNKLRLYPVNRLGPDLYARVKKLGFIWAPKQSLFVAPAWTPVREDFLMELCGEIEDEDTSLVERSEQRAERFENYSQNRVKEWEQAHNRAKQISDMIPLGQPILVGHHSEKRARKDAEQIENSMRKAVRFWKQSKYWEGRAEGAIRAAKYKERPDVRARRIKGLEAEKRKYERNKANSEKLLAAWKKQPMNQEWALALSNRDHISICFTKDKFPLSNYEGPQSIWSALDKKIITAEKASEICIPMHERGIQFAERWIEHLDNRLLYEKTMLKGQCAEDLLTPKTRPKQLPLCNYRAPKGISIENKYCKGEFNLYHQIEMTADEYVRTSPDYKATRIVENSHRVRTVLKNHRLWTVFLTDKKEDKKPDPQTSQPSTPKPKSKPDPVYVQPEPDENEESVRAMEESLKQGITVIAASQLFPTPADIAVRMVDLAGDFAGCCVLEPSAGTGNLIAAISQSIGGEYCEILAVEINPHLIPTLEILRKNNPSLDKNMKIMNYDFLNMKNDVIHYDKIIMNPPFENGIDIKHIKHAQTFLKPGGRLVALCANGPRQKEAFQDSASYWEDLPQGSFKDQGTGVNVALVVLDN